MYKRFITLGFVFCLMPLLSFASVSVHVDNSRIIEGESFRLSFTVVGESQNVRPDLTPLQQDFSILATSESVQVNIVNGNSRTSKQFTVILAAKRSGDLEIPPIRFSSQQSEPLQINVLSPGEAVNQRGTNPNFMESSVNNETPYVQSEVVYTLRLFTKNYIVDGGLTNPEIENAAVIRLGEDREYDEHRSGQLYHVIERKFAIFPQQSGEITIPGPMFSGTTRNNQFGSINPFFNSSMHHVSLTGDNIHIDVQPIPAEFQSSQWLAATQLSLSEHFSGDVDRIHVGDPIVRQITIQGNGLLAAQLPTFNGTQVSGANTYSEQVSLDNHVQAGSNVGTRVEQIVYIPTDSGTLNLPSLEIPWWNTRTDSLEVAQLPAKEIKILPGVTSSKSDQNQSTVDNASQITQPSHAQSTQNEHTTEPNARGRTVDHHSLLPWMIAITVFVVWLLTLMFWLSSVKKKLKIDDDKRSTHHKPEQYSIRTIRRQLQEACENNDKHAVEKLLRLWARRLWPEASFNAIADIMTVCPDADLNQQLSNLNQALYSKTHSDWDGQHLWLSLSHFKMRKMKKPVGAKRKLPPLYLN